MKRNTRQTLCLLTAIAVTASSVFFAGCSNKPAGNNGGNQQSSSGQTMSQEEISKVLAFKTEDVNSPQGRTFDGTVIYKNGLFYGVSSAFKNTSTGEDDYSYESTTNIIIFDESGNIKTEIPVIKTSSAEYCYGNISGDLSVGADGSVTCMVSMTKYDPDTYAEDTAVTLKTYDTSGQEIASADMTSVLESGQDSYISSWISDKDGNAYISTGEKVIVFDKSGTKLFEIDAAPGDSSWLGSLILTNEGKAAYTVMSYAAEQSSVILTEIDVAAKGKGKNYDLNGISGSYSVINGGGDYLLYAKSDTGVIGVKPDLTVESVLNLLSLGIDNSDMNGIYVAEDGSFYLNSYKEDKPLTKVYAVDASEIKEKKIITLGCFSTDWSMRSLIADYNKKNEEYTIVVNSYSDTNNTADYSAAQTAFNNELLSGKVPDIVLIDNTMPYDSYATKGLFTDLYELIDNDPELTRDSFMTNVLTAMETGGKLYTITPSYAVTTYAIKPSHLKNGSTISLTDAKAELTAMGEGAVIANELTREDFVLAAIKYSDFIDYEKASCDFDNDSFKAILEYSKDLPEKIDYDKLYEENPMYYTEHEMDFIKDKMLVNRLYLYDLTSFDYNRAQFGKDGYAFTNFPTDRAVATGLISTDTRISISNQSTYKDAAWDFIKFCLSDSVTEDHPGYYNNDGQYVTSDDVVYRVKNNMPILRDKFDLIASHALDPKYYYNSDGEKIPDENTYYLGGEDVKLDPMTQQELDKLIEAFSNTTRLDKTNEELMTILKDEMASYYAGNKTLDETVSIIQSRANIYMSEHY